MAEKTVIEDLPNELLTEIFKRVVNEYDLNTAKLVCHRWHSVIDSTIGIEISVSDSASTASSPDEDYAAAYNDILSLSSISKIGVKSCSLEYSETGYGFKKTRPPVSFKYPYLLRKLCLRAPIHTKLFRRFLSTAEHLSFLEVSLISFSRVKPRDLKCLHLPKLQELLIRKCMRANWNGFDELSALGKLQTFLKNSFPELRYIDARFPISNFKDFSTPTAIISFIQRHSNLKEIQITMDFPSEVNPIPKYEYQHELDTILTSIRNQPKDYNPNLKSLEIQGIHLDGAYPQLKIWQEFILRQHTLQYLGLRVGSVPSKFLDILSSRNSSTLQQLFIHSLNYTDDTGNGRAPTAPLSCKSFSLLKNIKTLYALGSSEISGVTWLPQTLTSVFLTGAMKTEDAAYILFHLQNLKFISFRNAFNQRQGCGITLGMLRKFIQNRKVKRLILNGSSLCDHFPQRGLRNGDSKRHEMLTIFEGYNEDNSYLDWGLNSNNYYVNKYY